MSINLQLPRSLNAEKIVLAHMIEDPDQIAEFKLGTEAFYAEAHREIYKTMLSLEAEGKNIEPFNLFLELSNTDIEKEAKAIASIDTLPVQAEEAAETIRQLATRRKLVKAAYKIIRSAPEAEDIQGLCSKAEELILDATEDQMSSSDWYEMMELADMYNKFQQEKAKSEGIVGVSTNIPTIDEYTGGLQDGTLIYMGGRPQMGKTDLAINVALNAAENKKKVLFFSLEMNWKRLMERIISNVGRVAANTLLHGIDLEDSRLMKRYSDGLANASRMPMVINDKAGLTLSEICSISRRAKRKLGLDIIVIDYLQKIQNEYRQGANLDMMVKEVSNGLANLAKNLEVPILCLSQLSRKCEDRPDKRPMLSDLRESGNLEQDADQVWGIYRHSYYHKSQAKENGMTNITELLILKSRDSQTGKVLMDYQPGFHRFEEADSYVYANYPYG